MRLGALSLPHDTAGVEIFAELVETSAEPSVGSTPRSEQRP